MNRQASILFDIIPSSISDNRLALQADSAQHAFYQRLMYSSLSRSIYTTEGFQSIGRQLADIMRHAYFARQMGVIEQASQLMLALPILGQLRTVARHYQALCAKQKGDFVGARRLLERVVEEATPQHRARALQAIGATHYECGEIDRALHYWVAAGKTAINYDLVTLAESQRGIAIIRSIHGDHKQALDDLERLFPLVRAIGKHYPEFYYYFLNSLAVEMGEVGRINEAQVICKVMLASPLSPAFPEFVETRDELEAKRTSATPSVVAVSTALEPAPSSQPAPNRKPSRWLVSICTSREKVFIQISSAITTLVIAHPEITRSILERVRHSINPRGPPSRSQIRTAKQIS